MGETWVWSSRIVEWTPPFFGWVYPIVLEGQRRRVACLPEGISLLGHPTTNGTEPLIWAGGVGGDRNIRVCGSLEKVLHELEMKITEYEERQAHYMSHLRGL